MCYSSKPKLFHQTKHTHSQGEKSQQDTVFVTALGTAASFLHNMNGRTPAGSFSKKKEGKNLHNMGWAYTNDGCQ